MIYLTEVGVGRGHEYYRVSVHAHLPEKTRKHISIFTLRVHGTLGERFLAYFANEGYFASGRSPIGAAINNRLRAGVDHKARLLRGSKSFLTQDGNLNFAFHAAVATGRKEDAIILSDVVAEPVAADGKSTIYCPLPQTTAELEKRHHPKGLIRQVGFVVHPKLTDPEAVTRRRTNLEKRQPVTVLFSLTGQAPLDHIRTLQQDLSKLAKLESDGRIKLVVDTCTHQRLAEQLERQMREAGFLNPSIFAAETAVESVALFVQAALASDVLVQMPGETTATAGFIPRINLHAVNPHAIGNQRLLEDPKKQMAISAQEVTEKGLAMVLHTELDVNQGRRLLANMERAATLPTEGAQKIAEQIIGLISV